ncbi:MAG: serine/threonine-protein kinase, partial [Planctomycetota bacterium]
MSASFQRRAKEVFERALELPAPRRSAFIQVTCSGDPELEAEVRRLLKFDEQDCELLDGDPSEDRWSALAADEPSLTLPDRIGPYRILQRLGVGGMGVVYRAREDSPPRDVALKVIRSDSLAESSRRRFDGEVQVLARLEHPGIARIYRSGTAETDAGPSPYFAMELVEGQTLIEHGTHGLSIRERLELFIEVLEAVHYAHERGVIHRDLKPENILVDATGRPKVLDFGIARSLDGEVTRHTRTGQFVGTLAYTSPEQLTGGELDRRSDVYSLGVVLYELLTGRPPFDLTGSPLRQAMRVIEHKDPRPVGELDPGLRGDLEAISRSALEKDPERRYATALAFGEDIRRFLRDEPISARPASTIYQMRKFARRHRALVGGTIATMIALLSGTIVSIVFALQADEQATRAETRRREVESSRAEMRRSLYQAQMLQAAAAVGAPQGMERVREIVQAWGPEPGEEDLRGWEWYFFQRWSQSREKVLRSMSHVFDLDWQSGGRLLAAAGGGSVMIGDVERNEWQSLDLPPDNNFSVQWDRAGHRLLIGSQKSFSLWQYRPESKQLWWQPYEGEAIQVVWDASETRVLVQGAHGEVSAHDAGDGSRLAELGEAFTERILSPGCVRPGEDLLAVEHHTSEVALVRTETLEIEKILKGSRAMRHVGASAWSPDGERLAVGRIDGMLTVWNARSDEKLFEVLAHGDRIQDLVWSPDGEWLASASWDQTVRIWSPGEKLELATLRGHQGTVSGLDWSDDGKSLASAVAGDAIRVWHVSDYVGARVRFKDRVHRAGLHWHPDGRRLAITSEGTDVYEIRDGRVDTEAESIGVPELYRGWNASGSLWVDQIDSRLRVRDSTEIREIEDTWWTWRLFRWHPRDDDLLAVVSNGELRIWRGPEASRLESVAVPHGILLLDATWLEVGHSILIASMKRLFVLDIDSREIEDVAAGSFQHVALDASGERVAVTEEDGTTRILRVSDWRELSRMRDVSRVIAVVSWHPDGRRLLTADRNRRVAVWDVERGEMLADFEFDSQVAGAAW